MWERGKEHNTKRINKRKFLAGGMCKHGIFADGEKRILNSGKMKRKWKNY
jgi:hypothetical protein